MRRLRRLALPTNAQAYLDRRQANANGLRDANRLNVDAHWKSSRQTRAVGEVLGALARMAGPHQRCMYCLDSHGSDVEHFRPKADWPEHMYQWSNLLLCCAHCGRLKGNQFPQQGRRAMLVNPTRENPWRHLSFDPVTGNLTALFDVATNTWSPKGLETVRVLHLDRREALSRGYLQTWYRLSAVVRAAMAAPVFRGPALIANLRAADDHGLLGWCFSAGATEQPFLQLQTAQPVVWRRCRRLFAG